MHKEQLDLFVKGERPGFRLNHLEVYNWGTFHNKVWTLLTHGGQNLLTGDVGSGKSSLVDALTTLLVPHNRITYNKAAGADKQERSLYTYVRGAYGNEQDEDNQTSKLLTLRDEASYSVILGIFHNEAMQRSITLAQVFRLRKNDKNPDRFYVLAEDRLSIKKDFFGVKKDISDIRTYLKKKEGCEVFESFKDYSTRFRQEFGIKSDQALDLFYQAVSMKSVGNLTEFVRTHMLEKTEVESHIQELCTSFEDLRNAHEAVLKARNQIEMLEPIVELGAKYGSDQSSKEEHTKFRNFVEPYFSKIRSDILQQSLQKLAEKKEKSDIQLESLQTQKREESENLLELEVSLKAAGGGRIQVLKGNIEQKSKEKERRILQNERYKSPCEALGLVLPKNVDDFLGNRNQALILLEESKKSKEEAETEFVDQKIQMSKIQEREKFFGDEIESLKKRQSNIPKLSLDMRANMAQVLGIDEKELPFVGELLQVKSGEKKWQGAIERILRGFGLSILVSEKHYGEVSQYVNKTHLRGKLVYFRVSDSRRSAFGRLSQDTLPGKLDIRSESNFADWLRLELEEHFNYICCDNVEDFQRQARALSLNGQVKTSSKRHEKDDRFPLEDKSRYILGWSNKEKIEALKIDLKALQDDGHNLLQRILKSDSIKKDLESRLRNCESLLHFQSFEDINWYDLAQAILDIEKEIQKLTEESDSIKTLEGLISKSREKLKDFEQRSSDLQKAIGETESNIKNQEEMRVQCLELLKSTDTALMSEIFPQLDLMANTLNLLNEISLSNWSKRQSQLRDSIQAKIESLSKIIESQQGRIIKLIGGFLTEFPQHTTNIDASTKSLPEISGILQKLKDEDLPRHEQRFYKKLKEDTIRGMAMFQELLEKERRNIENKIKTINGCLRDIDYNEGTYISILLNKTVDQEIVNFRNELKQILSNTTGPENVYTEQKFAQVKNVIDRFRGRSQQTEIDKKWSVKVTDVRNWFTFAASERFHSDSSEKEFYPDSGGKSGGQKEKLAYTVLASALAYQYGIEATQDSPKSFRFVMIDEAFGRGSDESARYGLTLFEKLNLQLLVVTPLQKIHVIEDYVSHVHFVHNEASKESRLHSLTIEQFREHKGKHRQVKTGEKFDA